MTHQKIVPWDEKDKLVEEYKSKGAVKITHMPLGMGVGPDGGPAFARAKVTAIMPEPELAKEPAPTQQTDHANAEH